MKFILKDGLIHIVDNHGIPNNNIEANIEVPDFKEPTVEFSINNEPFKVLKSNVLKIEKNYLQNTSIKLEFRVKQNGDYVYFKADTIPLTHTLHFGGKLEDFYPEILKQILHKLEAQNESIQQVRGIVSEQTKNTKKELYTTMKELVDTFEEITKKGSLF